MNKKYKITKLPANMTHQNAITLISLVITIVILIILASVGIYLSLGESGIFNRSKYAKEKYLNSQEEESKAINDLYSQLMISTNDSSKVTMSIAELKKVIEEQVDIKIQETMYPTRTLNIKEFTDTTTEQTYIVPYSGWLYIESSRKEAFFTLALYRNDMLIFRNSGAYNANTDGYTARNTTYVPVKKGDIIKKTQDGTKFAINVILYY